MRPTDPLEVDAKGVPSAPPERPGALGRRERTLVLVCIGIIALHVLDDNFIQPEPGTSAIDHLVSGLVPLAGLAAAAFYYARIRAGARATLAIAVGLFGIAVGLEGWYYTFLTSPSGDDFTGLIAVPAGILLLVVGIKTLWSSRRKDGSRTGRYVRRGLLGVATVLLLLVVAWPVLSAYVLTHVGFAVVAEPDLGTPHDDVTFTTEDGLTLEGWYVPSTNGAAVVVFAGREFTQPAARMLAEHGYGVLLFDRRGEGNSEGEPHAWGWGGEADVKAAVSFLQERPEVDPTRIGGIGFSVGGEMMLEAAAETPELAAVVAEGAGIRSVREHMHVDGLSRWTVLPIRSLESLSAGVFSNQTPPADLADLVGRIAPRPVFLIYADTPKGGEELNPLYFEEAGEPKELWQVPGSSHTGGQAAQPDEYEERVVRFFDDSLLGESAA